jgi:hypothetical protein
MIRNPLLSMPLLVGLALVGPGCGTADEPAAKDDIAPAASNSFELTLPDTTSVKTVIAQIVDAGHNQLAAACVAHPIASIRVFNPLVPGTYEDIACSTLLAGGEPLALTSNALTSGERLGETRQELTPIGLGCSVVMLGLGIFMNHALCQYPGAENPQACAALAEYGIGGLGLACAFI